MVLVLAITCYNLPMHIHAYSRALISKMAAAKVSSVVTQQSCFGVNGDDVGSSTRQRNNKRYLDTDIFFSGKKMDRLEKTGCDQSVALI